MGCGDEKLSKPLTQTFTAHCNAMICQQVTLPGDAEWPKVADAVIEAENATTDRSQPSSSRQLRDTTEDRAQTSDATGADQTLGPQDDLLLENDTGV